MLLKCLLSYFERPIQIMDENFAIATFYDLSHNAFAVSAWYYSFALTLIALFFAVPRRFYVLRTFLAIMDLPKAFLSMFLTLFKLKGANKKFIHTQHSTVGSH